MTENIPLRVQFKRMSADEWARSDVILLEGEIGFETDTGYAKFGNGKSKFSALKYLTGPKGPKGDTGFQGKTGGTGPRGPAGKPGTTDYNQLQNKPNLDAFARKQETDSKITELKSNKADKNAVYLKAESNAKLDEKLSLTGGIVTGQLQFKPNSGIKPSSSVGGAINIDMSKSEGAAMVMYTNKDTTDGPLMILRSDKDTFDQSAQFVDYSGKTNAVNIVMRQPSAPNFSSALNITSANEGGSAMQIRGVEKALGTLKITHENPNVKANYDENAAALSIDIVKKTNGEGTAAQGIYINSTSGTTGKLLRIRNLSDDKFYVKSDGGFYAKETSQIDGNLKLKDPTANDHAATKAYVDKAISELKKLILKK
ncbi:hyaluronoglucosaminidase [Streptococcus pyogenes JRS4]|uniref:hyaluronate lyase N-terminal domain-containing protein n=1 Tax=Streptococcus pyogenes TaxID=1314 RepID=UPI000040232B|nr:hyaluronoglucosaminidase [Streptococcus pyogenes]QBX29484.1 hyaluronate lyase [Streptococcus phage Javan498]HER4680000.1 hyaluronoglucosaminidase [Streptococcus pyogenes NGAS340]HER4737056.1 hyaluronoglucosaminidase [Streptococcus pyogenes NGAS311]HER4789094.1 hyaluronoglucosaminidase [Streptococcus pyogenes NGAS123]HER4837438.1 hyaluronoglucosaminidase [Streptococcus pyogenes NGAS005]